MSRNVHVALPEAPISGFLVFEFTRIHLVWSDVHGVDQTKAFLHAAPANQFVDLRRDVDESASIRNLELKMFSERFHQIIISTNSHQSPD
jgi:hypothetical protein